MNWILLIENGNAEELWNRLHELVSRYLLAMELYRGAAEASPSDLSAFLTQELFLELITKHRFERYIESSYSSVEIESDLLAVEIPCLALARLRDSALFEIS